MTPMQREVLERGARGHCERYIWRWFLDGRSVTRDVRRLIKIGLAEATYYQNGASIGPTEAGFAVLAKAKEDRT